LLQSAKRLRSTLGINVVARAFLISTEGGELKSAPRKRALWQMMDTHTKSLMLGIAASYEKIAKWADERRDEPR
jgi:hypothetical protein